MRPLALLLLLAAACTAPRRFEQARVLMGTRARVALYARDDEAARAAFAAAFARIEDLDAVLSDWREDSELLRLCAAPAGRPHAVGPDLYAVLDRSLRLAAETGGAFDPTLGPLTRQWRASRDAGTLPPEDARAEALALTGWQAVRLDPRARTVQLDRAGMRLDLGGIAKGYAADAVVALLRARGVHRCLVDLGGDMALGDAPPGAAGWEIRVGDEPVQIVRHRGVASSGDLERFVEMDGVRYSHVLDPRTGLGLRHGRRVTVVAPTATEADALATALSVLGRTDSVPYLRGRRDLRVFFEEAAPPAAPAEEGPAGPWREPRDGNVGRVDEDGVTLHIQGTLVPRAGTRFLVWRTGTGLLRQDVGVVEVVAAGVYGVTARTLELAHPRIAVERGMSVSSPFFDGFRSPRVHVDELVDVDRARLEDRLARAGSVLVHTLDDAADVVVLEDDAATALAEGRRDALTPRARAVVERAIAAHAIIVPASLMQRLIGD